MRFAIFGTGGVGGYFGGLLANAGHNVTFIARGPHLEAIRANGLAVHSINGSFTVHPASATDQPAEAGPVDYVIVAVKHYHLKQAAAALPPLVSAGTTVIPLLNGVDAHEILMEHVGEGSVVGGLCSVISFVEAPGVIRQLSRLRRVVVGELDHRKSERVEAFVQALAQTGAEAVHAADIHAALWAKFTFITSFSGIGALTRAPVGAWRDVPVTRAVFIEALREVEAVGRACGVGLPPTVVEDSLAIADAFEPAATASMQRDVADGKRFELDAFSGTVVRLGAARGVPTPVHRMFDALLRPALEIPDSSPV